MISFTRLSAAVSEKAGKPSAFIAACAFVVIWLATGPVFQYSDTWQLVINTSTTIITFLMVFLLQSTQNRDSCALHAKVDELIRTQQNANNALIGLQKRPDEIEIP